MSTPLREQLDFLLELQKIDSERDRLNRALVNIDTGSREQAKLDAAIQERDAARSDLSHKSGELKDAELELSGIEGKLKTYEQRMRSGQLTNARDIANVEKELNQLQRQRGALDDRVLTLLDEVDQAKVCATDLDNKAQIAQDVLKSAKNAYRANLARIQAEIGALTERHGGAECMISDASLLKRYDGLRARPNLGGVAIARIDDMHCGGCRTQVSSQSADRVVEAQQVVTCENCGRLLG